MKYNILSSCSWLLGLVFGLFFFSMSELIELESNHFVPLIEEELSFSNIFSNNIKVCIISILGALSLGILTCINLFYNGFTLSYLLKAIYIVDTKYYINLMPHSFEILGFIIAGSVGIKLGHFIIQYFIQNKTVSFNLKEYIIKVLLCVIIIFLSAVAEVYISPKIHL